MSIKIENPRFWSPEDPYLYNFKVITKNDAVASYFGYRKVSLIVYNGHKVIALNNRPYFMKGVLDQGYYKDGIYTPNSYYAYEQDIKLVKELGFNTIRKHIIIHHKRGFNVCWYRLKPLILYHGDNRYSF